ASPTSTTGTRCTTSAPNKRTRSAKTTPTTGTNSRNDTTLRPLRSGPTDTRGRGRDGAGDALVRPGEGLGVLRAPERLVHGKGPVPRRGARLGVDRQADAPVVGRARQVPDREGASPVRGGRVMTGIDTTAESRAWAAARNVPDDVMTEHEFLYGEVPPIPGLREHTEAAVRRIAHNSIVVLALREAFEGVFNHPDHPHAVNTSALPELRRAWQA